MNNEKEKLEHEAIKKILKMAVKNNPSLSEEQKQLAYNNIDIASQKADWIVEILRMCRYI